MAVNKVASIAERLAQATAPLHPGKYRPPSQTVDGLMDQLAADQDMIAFALTYIALLHLDSHKAGTVALRIPENISAYFILHRRISLKQFTVWEKDNPEWKKVIFDCIDNPISFENWLQTIERQMLDLKLSRRPRRANDLSDACLKVPHT